MGVAAPARDRTILLVTSRETLPEQIGVAILPVARVAQDRLGLVSVVVAGADVEGVVVALHEGARLSGRIEFEGGAPASTAGVRVSAPDTVLAGSYGSAGVGSIADDWSFELTNVWPGERVIRLNGLPSDFSLKAVYVDGEDVTDTPREFSSRESLSNVQVVVTKRITEVSGSVTDDGGRPVPDYTVIFFSTDEGKLKPGGRGRGTGRPDGSGRYRVPGLPPGEYFAVAVEWLPAGDADDPDVLSELRPHALRVTLTEGEKKTVDLKLAR